MSTSLPAPGRAQRGGALRLAVAAAAAVFGLATIASGGRVLFGGEAARAAAGAYVPFVLWFNFLAGFAYVAAAAGIALGRRWGASLAAALAVGTVLVFAALGVRVATGGGYEPRTVAAMILRAAAWIAIALAAPRWVRAAR